MPHLARAFWTIAPGRGEIRPETLPDPAEEEVLVRARVSGISRGTERLVFLGQVPDSLRDEMRCPFQAGDFPGPVKYGYSVVGSVEQGAPALLGRRVFVLHPHQDRLLVPASACRPVPDAVPDGRATLAANMETALNILWDGGAAAGQRIAIVGGGVVGCLVAYLAGRLPGAAVTLVDIDPDRAAQAAGLGVDFATPDQAMAALAPGRRDPAGCDLVVHASASEAGLAVALALAGPEATVVEASWYGDRLVAAPLGAGFHPRRLRLLSSQVGQVAPAFRPRWTHARRLELALRLLADPALDLLIDGGSSFAALPQTMAQLASTPGLCHLIHYQP